jgi:glycosyltransferase involved in cell wall biosynthesis
MTRVSILVPSLSRGGMTRAYALAGGLTRAGARVEIIGALAPGEDVYPAPAPGVSVVGVPERPFALRVLEARAAARGDVLYAVKPRVTSFGVALFSRRGRAVIVDVDDWEASLTEPPRRHASARARWRRRRRTLRRYANLDRPAYTRWMERHLDRADAVTANTRFLVERYRAVHVPSARDTDLFDPSRHDADSCRRALGLDGARVVMFPGTVRPHKGVEDAVAALELLGWSDARLVLVGGREAGSDLADQLALAHPRLVVRLGRFAVDEMPAVVAAAHVVVVPQRDTPAARAQFPIKLTDAMAMAKPIVATRVGDIPEILGTTAYLVPPSSPREIAAALERVFARPDEARTRGEQARRRCVERYSHQALAPLLSAVVENALRAHRDRAGRRDPFTARSPGSA